jgi:hypothetical protein
MTGVSPSPSSGWWPDYTGAGVLSRLTSDTRCASLRQHSGFTACRLTIAQNGVWHIIELRTPIPFAPARMSRDVRRKTRHPVHGRSPGSEELVGATRRDKDSVENDAMRAAANWIRTNCTNSKALGDLRRSVYDATAAGVNCWCLIGGGLLRSATPALLHCFVGELFVFQLTDAQAAIRGVDRGTMCVGRGRVPTPQMRAPAQLALSLSRLELLHTKVTQTTPLVGRVHYEVLANGGGPWCVRLDYEIGNQHYHAWDYPQRPLWGKGMLDISFLPLAPDPSVMTGFKGPLALFVRLCEMSPPETADSRPAISKPVASLVDVV